MLLPIYLYGQDVLHEETEDIEPDYTGLKQLIEDMWETMYHAEGVGLAAPQIGRSISLIVLDGSVLAETFPECKDSRMVLINPVLDVIDDQPAVSRDEGCLSLPGMSEPVKRIEHVRLNWLDENFEEHEQEFTGFLSRIMQHEYDHLLGKVYTDRVAPIRRQFIKSKLANIARGRIACEYRTKASTKRK